MAFYTDSDEGLGMVNVPSTKNISSCISTKVEDLKKEMVQNEAKQEGVGSSLSTFYDRNIKLQETRRNIFGARHAAENIAVFEYNTFSPTRKREYTPIVGTTPTPTREKSRLISTGETPPPVLQLQANAIRSISAKVINDGVCQLQQHQSIGKQVQIPYNRGVVREDSAAYALLHNTEKKEKMNASAKTFGKPANNNMEISQLEKKCEIDVHAVTGTIADTWLRMIQENKSAITLTKEHPITPVDEKAKKASSEQSLVPTTSQRSTNNSASSFIRSEETLSLTGALTIMNDKSPEMMERIRHNRERAMEKRKRRNEEAKEEEMRKSKKTAMIKEMVNKKRLAALEKRSKSISRNEVNKHKEQKNVNPSKEPLPAWFFDDIDGNITK